jgi:hypothetical protein
MKRIASPLFESTQMAQYSFWFVFGIAAMPACRRMYVFAATGRNGTACSNPRPRNTQRCGVGWAHLSSKASRLDLRTASTTRNGTGGGRYEGSARSDIC